MLLSYSDNHGPPAADSSQWPARLLLVAVALGGTLAYAASFRALPRPSELESIAACVALAAGVSWPAFGAVLLLVTGARPSALHWADACLRTMCAGVIVLALAAAFNLNARLVAGGADAVAPLAAVHAALLLLGNGLMLWTFVGEARRLGLRPAAAATLWMLVLNGTFLTTLLFLHAIGVM